MREAITKLNPGGEFIFLPVFSCAEKSSFGVIHNITRDAWTAASDQRNHLAVTLGPITSWQ
jgi:hypothetical protein